MDNIKMYLQDIRMGVNWIDLARVRDKRRDVVNGV